MPTVSAFASLQAAIWHSTHDGLLSSSHCSSGVTTPSWHFASSAFIVSW